jgi:hypothetical protein
VNDFDDSGPLERDRGAWLAAVCAELLYMLGAAGLVAAAAVWLSG